MAIKIVFSGTHCSGKTTCVRRVAAALRRAGFKVGCGSEAVRGCPFPVNEAGSDLTQEWILVTQMRTEMRLENSDVAVLDRCIFDHLAYARWLLEHGRLDERTLDFLSTVAFAWAELHPYSIIFLLEPLPLTGDGFRSINPNYQDEIGRIIAEIYREVERRFPTTTIIRGFRSDARGVKKITKFAVSLAEKNRQNV